MKKSSRIHKGEAEKGGAGSKPPAMKSQSSAREILLPLATSTRSPTEKDINETTSESLTEKFAGLQNGGDTPEGVSGSEYNEAKTQWQAQKARGRRTRRTASVEEEANAATAMDDGSQLKLRLSSVRHLRWKSASNFGFVWEGKIRNDQF